MASMRKNPVNYQAVEKFVRNAVGEDMHAKRVLSLSNATLGVMHAAALGVTVIGNALAQVRSLDPKAAVKQVDRLLSNSGLRPWELFGSWVPMVVGQRTQVVVAMDWTDFDDDDHTSICLYLLTKHGRATPLIWMTLEKSGLKGNRSDAEDLVLQRLQEVLPSTVTRVTVLADRGFGDVKLYALLASWGWDFVIRFRGSIHVTSTEGERRTATEWLPSDGRATRLKDARITDAEHVVPAVVLVKRKGMKDAWYLATSLGGRSATDIIKLYGRRFTIEEGFRDAKDWRFGMGLVHVHIKDCDRRDRMLLISAMAVVLLTLLGAASEATGLDKTLRVNTVKRRTHSLFTQGVYFYGALPYMKEEKFQLLISKFGELLHEIQFVRETFGLV
jgi:hypothetical protein